jgi:hypothetical protein
MRLFLILSCVLFASSALAGPIPAPTQKSFVESNALRPIVLPSIENTVAGPTSAPPTDSTYCSNNFKKSKCTPGGIN